MTHCNCNGRGGTTLLMVRCNGNGRGDSMLSIGAHYDGKYSGGGCSMLLMGARLKVMAMVGEALHC